LQKVTGRGREFEHRCGEVVDSPIDVVDVQVRADNGGRKLCDRGWRDIEGNTAIEAVRGLVRRIA